MYPYPTMEDCEIVYLKYSLDAQQENMVYKHVPPQILCFFNHNKSLEICLILMYTGTYTFMYVYIDYT